MSEQTSVHLDALRHIAYHSAMAHHQTDNPQVDPLTVGELISLQQAAEYSGLTKGTLHGPNRAKLLPGST